VVTLKGCPILLFKVDVGWVEVRLRDAQAALTRRVRVAQNPTAQNLVLG